MVSLSFERTALLALSICSILTDGANAAQNRTADTEELKTWWHSSGEINTKTPVRDENVRQSHVYSVQVSNAAGNDFYDSFVYEAIPRSGKGKACYPDNLSEVCSEYDGISIENDVGITMAWTQLLYGSDIIIKVTRNDRWSIRAEDVTIRPTNLDFDVSDSDGSAFITVPYTPDTNGVRFSIEFADDIWEYRKGDTETGAEYAQNMSPAIPDFVSLFTDQNPIVGREPKNALLVFASPFPPSDLVPTESPEVYDAQPGHVTGLESITNKIVSFGPGVYTFTGNGYANLSSSVEWVYLAPGAYVKGAIQYNNPTAALKATGFGVLSGELYVYQANPASGWNNNKSDATSLKMWRGESITAGQTWLLHGITTASPPFNAMDFYGNTSQFSTTVVDYKQVGGFYAQTDGLQMYAHSEFRDIFYHTGDDTIKAYHSHVHVSNIVAWKTNNAPLVQFGWQPRNVSNVTIENVSLVHSRYSTALPYAPRALIGSSSSYENVESMTSANLSTTLSNITISNIRAEGISPALLGLNLLSNIDGWMIKNVWIEELAPRDTGVDVANVTGFLDEEGRKVMMGEQSEGGVGMVIDGYRVGLEEVSFEKQNWGLDRLGRVSVDAAYWGKWEIRGTEEGDSDRGGDGDDEEDAGTLVDVSWGMFWLSVFMLFVPMF